MVGFVLNLSQKDPIPRAQNTAADAPAQTFVYVALLISHLCFYGTYGIS